MSLATLLLIALGVSADAFAVAVGKGLAMRVLQVRTALRLAVAFGLAQAVMPLLGWALASRFAGAIESVDHWVAFGLLSLVGGRMLLGALRGDGDPEPAASGAVATVGTRELLVLAVATSIDALAVGVSFALLDVDVLAAVVIIGTVTFALSYVGVVVGHRAGARLRGCAEVAGGVVLIAIGVKILIDHLGVL